MNTDPIYWLFSSSAQAVATFIAFLLAGYAIVLQLMDSAQEQDETRQPIYTALKQKYHRFIVLLLVLTGVSIISSLGMIYLNGLGLSWIGWPALIVFILNASSIGVAIWFVTLMIDPRRYQKEAAVLFAEQAKGVKPTGIETPRGQFFDAFVTLEREIRDFISTKRLMPASPNRPRLDYSFRQMIEILRENNLIEEQLYEKLLTLNRTRNLVFHGHINDMDTAFVDQLRDIQTELRVKLKFRRKRAGA